MRSLKDAIATLHPDDRAQVEAKAGRLIRAETLRQIRAAAKRTQVEVATASGMSQHNVSRLEKRSDMLLSTLNSYIEGLGGKLQIIAKIPGQDDVELDLAGKPAPRRRRGRAA
jgi:transcriptional regulator with XRE-family HTH domain